MLCYAIVSNSLDVCRAVEIVADHLKYTYSEVLKQMNMLHSRSSYVSSRYPSHLIVYCWTDQFSLAKLNNQAREERALIKLTQIQSMCKKYAML